MMNRNDIEEKNAANGRPVKKSIRDRSALALFALVSLSAMLSPVLIEDKQDLSADLELLMAQDVGENVTEHTDGGWRENETLMCAIISAGAIIAMLVVYFGFVRNHK